MVKRKTRHFKKEYALELIRVADGDLDSSVKLFATKPKRRENIFYLAEQCIEKCLKSVICASGKPVLITHSLAEFIQELPADSAFPFSLEIDELTTFATSQRYEEGKIILSDNDVNEVHTIAKQILDWAAAWAVKNVDKSFKV